MWFYAPIFYEIHQSNKTCKFLAMYFKDPNNRSGPNKHVGLPVFRNFRTYIACLFVSFQEIITDF